MERFHGRCSPQAYENTCIPRDYVSSKHCEMSGLAQVLWLYVDQYLWYIYLYNMNIIYYE